MRPASDSELWRSNCGEALPSTRNRARTGRRSASTLRLGKQFRTVLHLIEYHQPPEATQRQHGVGQAGDCRRILKIETRDIDLGVARNGGSERRLADLSRTHQTDDRKSTEQSRDGLKMEGGARSPSDTTLEISVCETDLSRLSTPPPSLPLNCLRRC